MLAEGNAFTHIQREIEGRQSAVVVAPVAAAGGNKRSSGSPAVKTTSNGGTKKPGATAKSQAAAASSGGAALSTSSASTAVNTSGDGARGGAIALDVESLSIEVEVLVNEQFRKYTPKLFNGDFKAVVDDNIAEWAGKFTLLMLDPPFGILDEAHDVLIPAADLLRECSRLLKPQGNVVVLSL